MHSNLGLVFVELLNGCGYWAQGISIKKPLEIKKLIEFCSQLTGTLTFSKIYSFGLGFLCKILFNFTEVVMGVDVDAVEIFNTGENDGLLLKTDNCGCLITRIDDKSDDLIGLFT